MNGATVEFRDSIPGADDYFALFESSGWNQEYGLTADELAAAIGRSWHMVSAYDQNQLIGTGRIVSDGVFHALIVDVIVSPGYRHHGLGSAIMQRLLERCRACRIRDVQLFCARDTAPFYSRLGFVARPTNAPGMDFRPA